MTRQRLYKAADYLHDCSKYLAEQFSKRGYWDLSDKTTRQAMREHDEMLALAGELRQLARSMREKENGDIE